MKQGLLVGQDGDWWVVMLPHEPGGPQTFRCATEAQALRLAELLRQAPVERPKASLSRPSSSSWIRRLLPLRRAPGRAAAATLS